MGYLDEEERGRSNRWCMKALACVGAFSILVTVVKLCLALAR